MLQLVATLNFEVLIKSGVVVYETPRQAKAYRTVAGGCCLRDSATS